MVTGRLSRDYWWFWAASTLSNLGDGLRLVALPLLAVTLTREPLLISGVTALTYLPWLLLGPVTGAVVDRADRRRLLIGVQAARGVVATVFAVAVATGAVNLLILYVTATAIAIGETLADSAAQASVPKLAAADQLEVANGRLLSAQMVTNQIAGAPIGGALFALAAAAPFFLDAGTYLAATLFVWFVRTDLRPTPDLDAPADVTSKMSADVVDGLRYVWTHQLLRPIAISAGLANFGAAAVGAVFVLFAIELLEVSAFGYGLLIAVGAAGGLLGALTAGRLVTRWHRRTVMVSTVTVSAASTAGLAAARGPLLAAAMLFITAASIASRNVVAQSLRQAIPPARMLGRVITGVRVIGLGPAPLGAIVGGAIASTAGLRAPFLLAALAVGAAAAVLAATMHRDAIDAAIAGNRDLQHR
ncbi:MFS transporter [Egicoccus sp. AB-alg2]|uniref:MFS transporter n=1 Tax=Egicoccus sp. AB-alg2 TaxID=3242693 RepID=UPI00359D2DF8